MQNLPNLVFTPDGELYTQNGVLEHLPEGIDLSTLTERYLHSLKKGDAAESLLTVILGVGYESVSPVEFRYSDPYAAVAKIIREAAALFSA